MDIAAARSSSLGARLRFLAKAGMLVAVFVVGLVVACSDSDDGGGTTAAAPRSGSAAVREGARLYTQYCQECHGSAGDRIPVSPIMTKAFLDTRGDATLLAVTAEGKGTMPAFGVGRGGPLASEDVRAVVAYLNSEAGRASTTLLAGVGQQLYAKNCENCHGAKGDRIPVVPLDAKGFLDSKTDSQLEDAILNGKGASPAFGQRGPNRNLLDTADTTAIISFLRYRVQEVAVQSVAAGRDLYVGNCLACHGASGDRMPEVMLADGAYLSGLGDGAIISAINQGTETGPAFGVTQGGGFAVTDTAALLAYLKSWAGLNATAALSLTGGGGKGEGLFVMNCAPCHGVTGDQVPGVQLRSSDFLSSRGQPVVRETIMVGNEKGMPAWGQAAGGPLSDEQVDSVVAFLFGTTGSAPAASSGGASGDPRVSAPIFDGKTAPEFFAANCSPCHGAERQGLVGPALLPERLTESDEFYQQTILNGRPGTPMPVWRDKGVTEEQAAALVAFIKSDPAGGGGGAAPSGDLPPRAQPIFDGKTAPEFFAANCSPCHGQKREGLIGPALLPERLTEDNDFYQQTILNGRPGTPMPVWKEKGVTEEQAAALVDFIKSDPNEPPPTDGSAASGGGAAGAAIFDGKTAPEFFAANCAPCHGAERQGLIGPALLPERLTESNEFYQQTILNGRPGTPMPVWKEKGVTEEQAAALVEFIKSDPDAGGASPPSSSATGGGTQDFGLAGGFLPVNYRELNGAEIFTNICSKCHGPDGLGVQQCPIGSKQWLQNMSEEGLLMRIGRGKPDAGMPTWGASHGGPFTLEQVRSVAKYLASQIAR